MITRSQFGHPLYGTTLRPTLAALKAMNVEEHCPNEEITLSDGRVVFYHPTCELTADEIFVFAPSNITVKGVSTPQAGAFLLASMKPTKLVLPVTYATADAAVLATVPDGCYFKPTEFLWHITTTFAGGSSSAVGVSSGTLTGYTTKGDLLGGASGDLTATLVSTGAKYKAGTLGAKFDSLADRADCILGPDDTIRWDRITSAYTSGVGNVIVKGHVIENAGA